jgi:ElaB/YqjD/DUF883 family membrane-anchored ribosome-binding protein
MRRADLTILPQERVLIVTEQDADAASLALRSGGSVLIMPDGAAVDPSAGAYLLLGAARVLRPALLSRETGQGLIRLKTDAVGQGIFITDPPRSSPMTDAKIRQDAEALMADVSQSLREAADRLVDDAEGAVAQAAAALREATDALVEKTPEAARSLAKRTVEEIKEHPLATAATALTAAAALISLLSAARGHKGS